MLDHFVNQAVLQRFLSGHEIVPLCIALHHFQRLARALGEDGVQLFLNAQNVIGMDADVRGLALRAAAGLVDQNFTVGKGKALSCLPLTRKRPCWQPCQGR